MPAAKRSRRPSAARARLRRPLRILHVAAEASPFVKTGGLADAVSGLAGGLADLGHDVRVLVPAYRSIPESGWRLEPEARFRAPPGLAGTSLSSAELPHESARLWLLEHPSFGERAGNPYMDPEGAGYPDNAQRFDRLCRAGCALAADAAGLKWRPDVLHAHDWHAGLVPVRMQLLRLGTPVVFTIHNLAYQGVFDAAEAAPLNLPAWLWHPEAMEFYGRLSFMKGGLNFADRLSTVSPTFAREILTPEYGEGLDGVLRRRAGDLTGILNGIDFRVWNPASDPHIPTPYSSTAPVGKAADRSALRRRLGLPDEPGIAVAAFIGRLALQKGVDLLLGALPEFLGLPMQLVVLGSGHGAYERALEAAARAHPERISVTSRYDEGFAHLIEAGADLLLMPSRYEPCGLTQLQSLRYGTVPVVRSCGGLADTVVDADDAALAGGTATGFRFDEASVAAFVAAVRRALALRRDRIRWERLVHTGMARDFSWKHGAAAYLDWYAQAIARRRGLAY